MKTASSLAIAVLLASLVFRESASAAEGPWTVTSPDGKVRATVVLGRDGKEAAKAQLTYRVEMSSEGQWQEVLGWSPLGIQRDDADLVKGLRFKALSAVTAIDEQYSMPHGKRRLCHSQANEQAISFTNAEETPLDLIVRVANDGVALRYRFPGPVKKVEVTLRIANEGVGLKYRAADPGKKAVRVLREFTGFRLPADGRVWMTPYQEAGKYTPAYEEYYLNEIAVGTAAPKEHGWAFPALARVNQGKHWVLLTEAAVDGSYCGCRLESAAPDGVYRIRFPDPGEGWGQGAVEPASELQWSTPWRVILVGESLGKIVESTLVTDLNPSSRVQDASWIRPGRAAWSWWSDHDSPQDYVKMREFVDLAAEMGWEYFLVDANWTLMDRGNVRELAEYARGKGVGLLLWYNSGGEHNVVTEKPRGCMKAQDVRKFEFELLRKWGVQGVKIDFFQSDKQNIMALYEDILRDAAEHRILINFHGCTLPRGWERTWPHLMSMEAVRGEECYTFAREFPEKAPQYNTILPYTRNAVGPMDYTPCAFTDDKFPHLTSNTHELALVVVFESGLLHFADRVSAYRQLPEAPKAFLRDIPVAWDDTRWLAGEPGKSAVIARRKGKAWWVGAINGQNQPQRLDLGLNFLDEGTYEGTLIADGKEPRSFASRPVTVRRGERLEVSLLPYGGAALRLKPKEK